MKSSIIARRSLRLLARVALPLLAATAASTVAALDLADQPLFSTVFVPGNLALALSVEWPTATTPAYPSTTAYSTGSAFLGYFDPDKCYQYTVVNSGTSSAPNYSTSYFAPNSAATGHVCSSTSNPLWSGNYLNWATMQTLDAFRWVLTGGYRSVDTASSTILTKTYAARDSTVMPEKTITASQLAGATPFTSSGFTAGATVRLRNIGSRMWITSTGTLVTGSATTGATAYTGQNNNVATNNSSYAAAGTTYELFVNVKVCDPGVGVEINCKAYGSNYKPEGLMQAYSSKLRYSAFGYYNHSGDTSQQRDGGVMRARMKYIAPTQPVPGSTPITNSVTEWSSSTGVMATNPDPTDASDTVTRASTAGFAVTITDSGVMNYLNKFGYSAQSYKSKDPVSELYYATLRYFKNLGNVDSYTTLSGAGNSATAAAWLDGFPAIATWDDPIVYACQKNFVLGIGDVNTHRDGDLPGSTLASNSSLEPNPQPAQVTADTTVNVATATNMVGKLEGYSGSLANIFGDSGSTNCANTGSQCNSYYIAGLAFDAHTKDIRADLAGTQTVNTYWMDVLENQVYKHKNQYWLAAKYGGFDVPTTFDPTDRNNSTTTIPTTTWYTSSDTLTRVSPATGAELTYSTDVSTASDSRPDNYFPGNRPDLMKSGLSAAFNKMSHETDSANGTAFSSPSPSVTNTGSISYSSTYDPKAWTGQVLGSSVVYAADGTPTLTQKWDAGSLLSAAAVTSATRKIVTCCTTATSAPGLAFTDTALNAGPLISRTNYTSFGAVPGITTQSKANYLLYLRGDTTKELGNGGVYRARASRLGDIVNSRPTPVGVPSAAFTDANNPGYSAFKTAQVARKTVVYVGSNDGMLHAFDGTIDGTTSGSELFAYIPSFAYGTTTTAPVSGLASLGNPSFSHHYFVDATPGQFDVDLSNTYLSGSTTPDWHTMLIGGLGKGGTGYYALDVTDPTTWDTEAHVAGKVMWEFTDSRMGYTYGTPSLVKTKKYGWVVVMTSGYNNSDGIGYFFFVNPKTGALLEAVSTGSSQTGPIDLGHHTAYIPDYTDMTADAIYAGDMQGNVWRLDVTGTTGTYAAPTLIAKLTDGTAAANPQPVTTRPLIETVPSTNKRYVLIGTGRLLADSDITSGKVQSFYAIADGLGTSGGFYVSATLPSGVTFPVTRAQLNANTDLLLGIGSSPTSPMGWYFDLPVVSTVSPVSSIAQRVDIDPAANAGIVAFAGNTPNGSSCNPAGSGTVYAVAFATGKTVLKNTGGNNFVTSYSVVDSDNVPHVVVDIGILRINGTLRLIAGDSKGNALSPNAALGAAVKATQLNWRDIPPTN